MKNHHVPQSLAKNLAAPVSVFQIAKTNAVAWKVKEIETSIATPGDVKLFQTTLE